MRKAAAIIVLLVAVAATAPLRGAGPSFVDITWFSVSNLYYELGPLRIITDGFVTRIPQNALYGGGGGYANSRQTFTPDVPAVTNVLTAFGGPSSVNLLLSGHSHFDHAFDTAAWSKLSGAKIIGPKTTCFQVVAQGVAAERCTAVNGGERLQLADGVVMRVVRWNHSGDSSTNPEQHNPVELSAPPTPDPATGGLRPGVAEDFPNGGGGRAFLFTVDGPDGRFTWFFQNSASASDLATPIVIDGVDYGAPIENLKAALRDAGLQSVDLWIGTGGSAVATLVLPILKPKAYLPVHWDSFFTPFLSGVPRPYADAGLEALLSRSGVTILKPAQYMDKWRLDRSGVRPMPNASVKRALGFRE